MRRSLIYLQCKKKWHFDYSQGFAGGELALALCVELTVYSNKQGKKTVSFSEKNA